MTYDSPHPISADHDVASFRCGRTSLDDWLRRRAFPNEAAGASRTFVTTLSGSLTVVGYYALAAGSVRLDTVSGRIRRNMPDPIPVVVLARLAVDTRHQKSGLGRSLLQDAIVRSVSAATTVDMRAMIIHALTEEAGLFYVKLGFAEMAAGRLTYAATIADLVQTLGAASRLAS